MNTKLTIPESNKWLKWGILLVAWILSLAILIIVTGNNELSTLYNNTTNHLFALKPAKNQTGAITYTRWDPEQDYRPVFFVSLKNLCAENNRLGIFKTALHKVVKIRDLELKFYQYTSAETTAKTSRDMPNVTSVTKEITTSVRSLIDEVMRKLTNREGLQVNNLDLSNVSEVRINDFDYRVYHNGDLFLRVRSKRVVGSHKQSEVVLRGLVTIESSDGSTLHSNYIKWDMENQYFSTSRGYVLNRNGVRRTGEDICVNAQLNEINAQHAELEPKEERECFAKLQ